MSFPIKTSISSCTDIFDVNGLWLPKGNYYFSISRITRNHAEGELYERAFQAAYKFKLPDIIRMMSASQARLARRASIVNLQMPSILSPSNSPTHFPNLIARVTPQRIIHTSPTNSVIRRLPTIPPEGESSDISTLLHSESEPVLNASIITCTICLNAVVDNKKTLTCNHHFHTNCIDRWIRIRPRDPRCPICRRRITIMAPSPREVRERIAMRNHRYNIITNTRNRNTNTRNRNANSRFAYNSSVSNRTSEYNARYRHLPALQ
jgi:hypothetical protein